MPLTPLQGNSNKAVLPTLPPYPLCHGALPAPLPCTGTASTLQDYLLLVFAPVSLCSGTQIPSILPLPGPAAHSHSQRGILAAGARRPTRGAPLLPPPHARQTPAHPNARAGLARGGDMEEMLGALGQREGVVLGLPHPCISRTLSLEGLWEKELRE